MYYITVDGVCKHTTSDINDVNKWLKANNKHIKNIYAKNWNTEIIVEVNEMEFIKDLLRHDMKLKDVCTKYGVTTDDILERYHEERSKYTDDEIEEVMRNVYYK